MAAEKEATRRWWAPIGLGAALCVACCLAPLLAAAGLATGGVALLSLSWLEPLGVGLIIAGALGLIWARVRARNKGCAGDNGCEPSTSDTNAGCGCTAGSVR